MTASASMTAPDWTRGGPGIRYQRCQDCAHVWYFHRDFCPACGAESPREESSTGRGVVHATTLLHRAPSDDFRALAPYRIVLVDVEEGFRMMGHGDQSLAIGDRVVCRFREFAGGMLPHFEKENP